MRRVIGFSLIVLLLTLSSAQTSAGFPADGIYISLESETSRSYDRFDGKMVLVEAFATWCEPCLNEQYHFSQIKDVYGDNLTLFSLSVDSTDSLDDVRNFKAKAEGIYDFSANWEYGLDRNEETEDVTFAYLMNISVIPTTFLIDEEGSTVKRWEGVVEASNISQYINANVTFPDQSQSQILFQQVANNIFFRIFTVLVVVMLIYQFIIPKSVEEELE